MMFKRTLTFIKHWFWLIVLIATLCVLLYFGFENYLRFDFLKQHRESLLYWVQHHYIITVIAFSILYVILVAISFPGASYLTIVSGFLFGTFLGMIYVVCAATIGSIILFLAVRNAVNPLVADTQKTWINKMRQGFSENEVRYLFFLRILPIFPFWAVNVAAAVLNVRLITFILVTFIGIIPGTFIYALLGSGLGTVFDQNKSPNMGIIFEPYVLLPLIALAILSIFPVLYNKWRQLKTR